MARTIQTLIYIPKTIAIIWVIVVLKISVKSIASTNNGKVISSFLNLINVVQCLHYI